MLTFGAALFDMDGTLLDSMGVWADVDKAFFASRGMAVPEDYAHSISGLSFKQTAVYTKERFNLPESVDEILSEWNEMCEKEYVNHVPLKEDAKEYLEKTDESLETIAFKLYFYDVSAFIQAFKKSTGETPTEYRKKRGIQKT